MKNVISKDEIQGAIKRIKSGDFTIQDFLVITEYQNNWVYEGRENMERISNIENYLLYVTQLSFNQDNI